MSTFNKQNHFIIIVRAAEWPIHRMANPQNGNFMRMCDLISITFFGAGQKMPKMISMHILKKFPHQGFASHQPTKLTGLDLKKWDHGGY